MKTYPAVKEVTPIDDYRLVLVFSNRERRLFDVKPYLDKGIFRELKDVKLFNTARVSFDAIEWDNEADLDPEVLYKYSKKYNERKYHNTNSSKVAAEPHTKYKKKI